MPHLYTSLLLLAAAASVVIVLALGIGNKQESYHPLIGKSLPSFAGEWLHTGKKERVENIRDRARPLILNFWASWCLSCRNEARILENFWKNEQIQVIGIAVRDDEEEAKKFAEQWGKSYPLALDPDGETSLNYGLTGVPETFIIDKQGIVRHHMAGEIDRNFLNKALTLN